MISILNKPSVDIKSINQTPITNIGLEHDKSVTYN